ncbi:hypothetical protein EVAR_9838_1 [Eumeta japonica]|uniref:Uncharacterized protein n=1 Tax=Eumeta variegata TaxID=151549 RepID=A0A4C1TQ88_EUMVA|nr:hypothetical protein EVAR_9838_1 [Eumeta japonica]
MRLNNSSKRFSTRDRTCTKTPHTFALPNGSSWPDTTGSRTIRYARRWMRSRGKNWYLRLPNQVAQFQRTNVQRKGCSRKIYKVFMNPKVMGSISDYGRSVQQKLDICYSVKSSTFRLDDKPLDHVTCVVDMNDFDSRSNLSRPYLSLACEREDGTSDLSSTPSADVSE